MKILAKPIDAIVVFRGLGMPLPYKFRYAPTVDKTVVIVVERILSVEEKNIAGMRTYVYDCQSIIDGSERRYELKYSIGTCRWELYKF